MAKEESYLINHLEDRVKFFNSNQSVKPELILRS